MTRQVMINLEIADHTPATMALSWAVHNARNLGYSVPTEVDMALKLLTGKARVPFFISLGGESFFATIEGAQEAWTDDDISETLQMMELLKHRFSRRRQKMKLEDRSREAVAEDFGLCRDSDSHRMVETNEDSARREA